MLTLVGPMRIPFAFDWRQKMPSQDFPVLIPSFQLVTIAHSSRILYSNPPKYFRSSKEVRVVTDALIFPTSRSSLNEEVVSTKFVLDGPKFTRIPETLKVDDNSRKVSEKMAIITSPQDHQVEEPVSKDDTTLSIETAKQLWLPSEMIIITRRKKEQGWLPKAENSIKAPYGESDKTQKREHGKHLVLNETMTSLLMKT